MARVARASDSFMVDRVVDNNLSDGNGSGKCWGDERE
jgi:hypothetical protein